MALRSIVVEAAAGPPAPRRTVVVRTGAPAPKGKLADVIVGIIGLILLVAAIGLAWYLPDRTYLNPQFRMSFPEFLVADLGSSPGEFEEAGATAQDFPYELPGGNIKVVTMKLGFIDDLPYSMPDRFQVELVAPNGTPVAQVTLENPRPREGPASTDPPVATPVDEIITVLTLPTPQEQIVAGLSRAETPEQVLARLEPQFRVDNGGTWIVRVTLLFAGDCPQPGQEGSYPSQPSHCVFGSPSNVQTDPSAWQTTDVGNEFIVQDITYTFYTVDIQELS